MRLDYICGIDLARRFDFASFVLLQRTPIEGPINPEDLPEDAPQEEDPLLLRVIYALQARRNTPYEDLAKHAAALALHPKLRDRVQFIVDATGVGDAALELFDQQIALHDILWALTISPGQAAIRKKGMRFSVPKKDLKDAVLVNLQRRRLVACPQDPWHMEELRKQLFAFKPKQKQSTGHIAWEALTEADHDDLVIAAAAACWLSSQLPLEDMGEYNSEASTPHILVHGPASIPRYADSWRGDGGPETHRPAGLGPTNPHQQLPPQPPGPPNPNR